jgi:epoxyqueuosine reductase
VKRDKTNLVNALKERAEAEGFVTFGIAPATLSPLVSERLHDWLAQGHHGEMIWMADRTGERSSPDKLWPEVKSVVILGMSYAPDYDPMAFEGHPDKARISVYAQGRDYHDVVKGALKRIAGWLVSRCDAHVKVFVDTAPVMEKALAQAAGIGWQGKHSNIVSRDHGSWLFLGAIYTTADLASSRPSADRCGSCEACQTICPTDAFPAPYKLDARRCISYLTIELKGPIPHEFRHAIGNHIYGCDDCLAVCPWNKFAQSAAAHKAFTPREELLAPDLDYLLTLDDAAFRKLFSASPVKRIGRDRFIRNVLIAAGNSGDTALVDHIISHLDDPSPVVRGSAVWALGQLDKVSFAAEGTRRLGNEQNRLVVDEWDLSGG